MDFERRGGRGDRVGRYGNTMRFHNFQDHDPDYRDYGPEDEEFGYDCAVDHRSMGFERTMDEFSPDYYQPDLSINSDRRIAEFPHHTDNDSHIMRRGGRPGGAERFPPRNEKRKSVPAWIDEYGSSLEEMRDQDCRADLDYNQKPSHIVMLRMLPPNATANEIRAQLQDQGIQPKEVRLMRNKTSGQSRGFAFVEFNLIQEAARWMETNQGVLLILGQRVSMHYSDPKPRANEDWLCNKCGVQNFKRREKCFKCCVPKSEGELKLPQFQQDFDDGHQHNEVQGLLPVPAQYQASALSVSQGQATQHQSDANDTLILRNLGQYSSVDAILAALSPFATLSPSNIRLIKDKHTNLNRGFAFLQLSTIVEASQLLQILQALQPPLSVDGKAVVVEFAKGSKRDVFQTDGNKVSSASVASTAIAAAQWAVTQNASGGGARGPVFQQAAAVTYSQEALSATDSPAFKAQAHSGLPVVPTTAPETYTEAETTEGALIQSGVPNAAAAATLTSQAMNVGANFPSQPATPGTEHEHKQYPIPDTSTYQYDESSGYYYDPFTGLYYDANSQYYFNPHTQQYMYWDGETHTYIPADGQSSSGNADTDSKDKKEKTKSKTAQQIAKDMERWAKSLNRHKENMRSASGSAALAKGHVEDQKESASADAGYAVLEKKGALLERPQMNLEQIRQSVEIHQRGLVPAYDGADSDEEAAPKDEREDRITDWSKLACLLCQRQFPSKEALIRHQQLSELHKQNLEQRRILLGQETNGFQPPDFKKRKMTITDGIIGAIPGVRMLK